MHRNTKLFQSDTILLECDWSKNQRLQENLRFSCKIGIKMHRNTKLFQSDTKFLQCDWSKNQRIQENLRFSCKI